MKPETLVIVSTSTDIASDAVHTLSVIVKLSLSTVLVMEMLTALDLALTRLMLLPAILASITEFYITT